MKKIYVAPEMVQMEIELQKIVAASPESITVSNDVSTFENAESRQGGSFSIWDDDDDY